MQSTSPTFDALFHSILVPEVSETQAAPLARGRRPLASPELEVRVRRAIALFHQSEYERCVESLEKLRDEAAGDARVEAFAAASRALADGAVVPGVKACLAALKRETHVSDVCCALGALLLHAGDRARALQAFRKGLDADPVHPYLRAKVRAMGLRRPPVVRRLPRTHPVNRVLGLLRARLAET